MTKLGPKLISVPNTTPSDITPPAECGPVIPPLEGDELPISNTDFFQRPGSCARDEKKEVEEKEKLKRRIKKANKAGEKAPANLLKGKKTPEHAFLWNTAKHCSDNNKNITLEGEYKVDIPCSVR